MFGIEKSILIIICIAGLGIGLFHLLRKNRSTIGVLYSLIAIIQAVLASLQIILLYAGPSINTTLILRGYCALFILGSQLAFHIVQLYPGRIIRRNLKKVLLLAIPGLIMAFIACTTPLVIREAVFTGRTSIVFGSLFPVFIIMVTLYITGNIIILAVRSFMIPNKAFSREIRYISAGMLLVEILFISLLVWLISLGMGLFAFYTVVPLAVFMFLVISNNSFTDLRHIDYKNYYMRLLYWVSYIGCLFLPIYFLFLNRHSFLPQTRISSLWLSLITFAYMVFFFRYARPGLERFFRREFLSLTKSFNDFFQTITDIPLTGESQQFWDTFYSTYILGLKDRFSIGRAYFMQFNPKKGMFTYVYGFGDDIVEDAIPMDSPILGCFSLFPELLYKSRLYTDPDLEPYKNETLKFFKNNNVDIALPFYTHQQEIGGILFLGLSAGKKSFSGAFISALHLYRLQFQRQFSTRFIMEDIKATQVIEHDRMVLALIKKKILPAEMPSIPGYAISSFFIDNSVLGGDYFDAFMLDENHLALFLSDCSYTGIDSSITALELYSVLHTPTKQYAGSPASILTAMNWVMNTSSFSNHQAQALCVVLSTQNGITMSGAAGNPLLLYDIPQDEFQVQETGGIPLGIERSTRYENINVRVHVGMIGIIYSDGIIGAINNHGEIFGLERLKKIIRAYSEESPAVITRQLYKEMETFLDGRKQQADMTVLIFRT